MNSNALRARLAGPIATGGFATALVLWTAWFVTHLPWTGLSEQASLFILLGLWALSLLVIGLWFSRGRTQKTRIIATVGLGAGVLSALIGLLVLGSKLTTKSTADHQSLTQSTLVPNAGLIAVCFVALGGVIGAAFASLGGLLARRRNSPPTHWLSRFALVTVVTTAPLLFIGGLVTSTNSGMAVPDWPNTYGSNMFLYPLGPRVQLAGDERLRPEAWPKLLSPAQREQAWAMTPEEQASFIAGVVSSKIFLEHSHRLFGTLVGLASLVLMIWTLRSPGASRTARTLAVTAFILVCLQGALGGWRVLQGSAAVDQDNRFWSMAHGVLGQLTFGVLVATAVALLPGVRGQIGAGVDPFARKFRTFATAALHTSILQLILGAVFRHFRHSHVMWTHVAFSLAVVALVCMGALSAIRLIEQRRESSSPTVSLFPWRALRNCAYAVVLVVMLQFMLGWVTLLWGAPSLLEAATPRQAILRTSHQALGATMLALVVALYTFASCLAPRRAPRTTPATYSGASTA
jgi:heme A synthase